MMTVRGLLEVDLECPDMGVKSKMNLVPRPQVQQLRPSNWIGFMGKPFVVETVKAVGQFGNPINVGEYDPNSRIEVECTVLEGLPRADWEAHGHTLYLDYGERECDIPYDQV